MKIEEKTVKNGQTEMDGRLYDAAAVTLYDEPYIRFGISGLDMIFKISFNKPIFYVIYRRNKNCIITAGFLVRRNILRYNGLKKKG